MSLLNRAQREEFSRAGFLVFPGFLPRVEIEEVAGWLEDLAGAPDQPGRAWKYHEEALLAAGRRVLSRIEYFRAYHSGLRALMEAGRLAAAVSELLGEEALLFKDKVNFKYPGGAHFEPHQDAQAGWLDYCPNQITALVSVDATRAENGAVEFAAGHHRRGLIGALWEPLTSDQCAAMEFSLCETQPGDVVFFDAFTPHRSGPNHTARARRVLYLTYNARSQGDHYEPYFAAKRKNLPPDCEREPGRSYRYKV